MKKKSCDPSKRRRSFSCSDAEWEKLVMVAGELDIPVSQLIRRLLREALNAIGKWSA